MMVIDFMDLLFIIVVLCLLLVSIIGLLIIKRHEKNMKKFEKARKDMVDLEAITKNIETNYRPMNIELTSYEKEQEDNAIISYEELVNSKKNRTVNYDDTFVNDTDIEVKKVDLNNNDIGEIVQETKIEFSMMSYEKEEAFLKALKQLQSDLAR